MWYWLFHNETIASFSESATVKILLVFPFWHNKNETAISKGVRCFILIDIQWDLVAQLLGLICTVVGTKVTIYQNSYTSTCLVWMQLYQNKGVISILLISLLLWPLYTDITAFTPQGLLLFTVVQAAPLVHVEKVPGSFEPSQKCLFNIVFDMQELLC